MSLKRSFTFTSNDLNRFIVTQLSRIVALSGAFGVNAFSWRGVAWRGVSMQIKKKIFKRLTSVLFAVHGTAHPVQLYCTVQYRERLFINVKLLYLRIKSTL